MTETTTQAAETLTVYPWWDQVPDHLTTKTTLDKEGLKPGGPARAIIHYGRGRREREYELFDRGEAVPKREATPAQRAALEKAHLALRTCRRCGAVKERPSDLITCADAWRRGWELRLGPGCCWACEGRAVAAERAQDRDEAIRWARGLAGRQDWCVLDTETAGLWGPPLEVAVLAPDGAPLFESLVRPEWTEPPTEEVLATDVHGITWAMLAPAPTFAQVAGALAAAVAGRTVVVYNRDYDEAVLDGAARGLPERGALAGAGWECAMLSYSAYVGEWRDDKGDYQYQPLEGGHRAAGDCRAVLDLIRRMAGAPLSTEPTVTDAHEQAGTNGQEGA